MQIEKQAGHKHLVHDCLVCLLQNIVVSRSAVYRCILWSDSNKTGVPEY